MSGKPLLKVRDLVVSLLNEEHQPVMVWKVMRAFPVKVEGPALKASGNEVSGLPNEMLNGIGAFGAPGRL